MNLLHKQLEDSRFSHTLSYIKSSAKGLKRLNPTELAHLNQMIEGKKDDPWRNSPVSITLHTGKKCEFSLVSNPLVATRNLLSYAHEVLAEGNPVDAATFLYSQLVMNHFFTDGNRRTAVAAIYWLLAEKDIGLDADKLLLEKLGDLREEGEIRRLKTVLKSHITD